MLTNQTGNISCVDCCQKFPTWLSLGFGTLICIDCAGKHRELGAHITRVRSLEHDAITEDQLNVLRIGGNEKFLNYIVSSGIIGRNYNCDVILYYRFVDDLLY